MLITGIAFFLILSILVLVHELGHYTMARIIGVEVEEFGLGLPPRIFGKKIKGTIYSINWLPIGGFVKLKGEDEEGETEKIKGKERMKYFWARSKKERALILIAGVTMNFLLATVITTGLLIDGVPEPSGKVRFETIVDQTPAKDAGFLVGDIVESIDYKNPTTGVLESTPIKIPKDLIDTTKKHQGEELVLNIIRKSQKLSIAVTPRKEYPSGQGPMGVSITDLETVKYPWYKAPIEAVRINLTVAWSMVTSLGSLLFKLITFTQKGSVDVAGPIGIAKVTGQAVKFGFRAILEFMSLLSLNLAVLNVLPFPALDGGRLLFVFIEKILGRKVRPAFERSTHQIGMIILFVLIFLVSINDIIKLATGAM
jgi:regulator of sigma E protease